MHTLPVSKGLPYIGHMIDMGLRPLSFLIGLQQQYHPLVTVKVGAGAFTLITEPALIEQILVQQQRSFQKDSFLKVHANAVFGNGLLASDGDFWLRQRRMAQPAFHRARIATYAAIMTHHGATRLAQVPRGEWFDFHQMSIGMTLDIAADALFSHLDKADLAGIAHSVAHVLTYFSGETPLDILGQIIHYNFNPQKYERYRAAVTVFDEVITRLITARRASTEPAHDLLQMLIDARDDQDQPMSDRQLLDECKTMFLAGHETSALSLSWTIWLLSTHPELQARAAAEVAAVIGTRTPVVEDVAQLPFLDAVIRESMRLYPPAWVIQRETLTDVLLSHDGKTYTLPAHHDVLMSPAAMHRDPRWHTDPERFDPDRWTQGERTQLPKYAYFPFGGGPRLCIGQAFAQLEVALVLAQCLQRGTWEVHPRQKVVAQPSITQRPKYGLKMRYR
ncbi:MAG: hypothetical protein RLZZ297_204 [Chloroflexota bacterium]